MLGRREPGRRLFRRHGRRCARQLHAHGLLARRDRVLPILHAPERSAASDGRPLVRCRAMQTAFISSIQSGFEDVRAAARAGVESFGWRAMMAETIGAAPTSPQRALLDRVADSDALLLLVGPRYGARQESGVSATEDEFDEARRRGKPILVLRQEGELEPEQQELVERATGGWEGGALYGTFRDASDVGLAVVRGLTNIRDRGARATLEPAAQERAAALAADARRQGYGQGGSIVRVVLVPLIDQPLLQAAALEDRNLPEELAAAARAARLVPESKGIATNVSAAGIQLHVGEQFAGQALTVGANGEIVVEASVGGGLCPAWWLQPSLAPTDPSLYVTHGRSSGPSLTAGSVVPSARAVLRPPPTPSRLATHFRALRRLWGATLRRQHAQAAGPGRASPVPAATF
jgi:hypothetical protein